MTSESAKLLVRYLADVEADNEENIPVILSSSKMGWIRGKFLPYDTGIEFDGAARFRQIYESIQSHGSREKWYQRVLDLRKKRCFEIRSFRKNGEICVQILDDGAGFDTEKLKDADGIAIRNLKLRLKEFLNADLEIESRKGEGCRQTIHIPWEETEDENYSDR